MTDQRHKEAIQRLVEYPGNNECAECFLPNPSYCSTTLGIFLCPVCAKLHQKCIPKLSEVVLILNHKWNKAQVDILYTEGNKIVNARYEKLLPIYYHRPRPDDPEIIFEQWILAKYVREEFMQISQQSSYNQGTKTGALFKRAKDQDKFQRRKFILCEPDGKLQYFIKYSDKHPKDTIAMRNMVNVYLVPEKVGNENGMQITYEKDSVRRNLYVFGEDGKSTSDWYHAIRASMARHKYKDFPDNDVKRYLNTTVIREGWMSKTGPRKLEKFRKRWFSLIGTAIWYYVNPLDAHPLGYIALGSKTFGYGVMRGFPKGIKEDGYGMTIHTPERVFVLYCENMDSRERWVKCIENVLASCTTVWTKPSIGKLGYDSSVINVDDVPDLTTPSTTTVFTELPTGVEANERKDTTSNSIKSEIRTPLFEKNPRAQKKDLNKESKLSLEKKAKHGGTMKISKEEGIRAGTEIRPGSKKYSDDSDMGSDDETPPIIQASPRHKQTERILLELEGERRRLLSSATDDDSDEEVVVLGRCDDEKRSNYSDDSTNNDILQNAASTSNPLSTDEEWSDSHIQSYADEKRYSFPVVKLGETPSPNRVSPVMRPKSAQSPRARPRSNITENSAVSSGRSTPKKPPRRKLQDSDNMSISSDVDAEAISDDEQTRRFFNFSQEHMGAASTFSEKGDTSNDVNLNAEDSEQGDHTVTKSEKSDDSNCTNLLLPVEPSDWRSNTFTSIRRVQGKERKTLKRPTEPFSRTGSVRNGEEMDSESKTLSQRPVDITIANFTETSLWFMLFQAEENPNDVDSYVTPWLGAEIAEMPASVGPIRLPSDFEIAVIDTAPGGYGLQRTTGPFYAEIGDVWEVEIPVDDGSAPDMFYHEGMETEDGSVMVYSNVENSKKFEIAVFKSGRKLFCRKNVRPGDAVGLKVQPSLYVVPVDQDTFYEMEGEDVRLSDILPKASKVELNFRMAKMKILGKKRGRNIFFTSDRMRYTSRK